MIYYIPGTNKRYYLNDNNEVINAITGRTLKPYKHPKTGLLQYSLNINKYETGTFYLHKLIKQKEALGDSNEI